MTFVQMGYVEIYYGGIINYKYKNLIIGFKLRRYLMSYLLIILSILLFLVQFVDLHILNKNFNKLQEISSSIIDYTSKLDMYNIKNILTYMKPKSIKKYGMNNKEYKFYKNFFYNFIWYFLSGIIAVIIDIILLILSMFYLSGTNLEICLTTCTMNILLLWAFKLSGVFHCLGLNRVANTMDNIVYDIISPKGKLNEFLYKKSVKIILYIIDFIAFLFFYKYLNMFIRQFIEIDFLVILGELIIFQYILGKLIILCISKIFWAREKNRKKFENSNLLFVYFNDTFKNTTYLVLLTIYVVNKYAVGAANNFDLLEAIGVLFLIDTYFEKNRTINSYLEKE